MTVRDRIQFFLDSKGIKAGTFERELGVSKGYWSHCKNPSADVLEKILFLHTDLSAEYILRGKGPMLLTAARGSAPATFTTHNDFSHRDGDQVQGDKIEVSGSGNNIKPQSPDPSTTIEALLKLNADLVSLIKSQQS